MGNAWSPVNTSKCGTQIERGSKLQCSSITFTFSRKHRSLYCHSQIKHWNTYYIPMCNQAFLVAKHCLWEKKKKKRNNYRHRSNCNTLLPSSTAGGSSLLAEGYQLPGIGNLSRSNSTQQGRGIAHLGQSSATDSGVWATLRERIQENMNKEECINRGIFPWYRSFLESAVQRLSGHRV